MFIAIAYEKRNRRELRKGSGERRNRGCWWRLEPAERCWTL